MTRVRCAHGDILVYPLAKVEIEIAGERCLVEAGVVDKLPVSVLLGWDTPQLEDLLRATLEDNTQQTEESMAVVIRAQKKQEEEKAAIQDSKEQQSGATPHPPEEVSSEGGVDYTGVEYWTGVLECPAHKWAISFGYYRHLQAGRLLPSYQLV